MTSRALLLSMTLILLLITSLDFNSVVDKHAPYCHTSILPNQVTSDSSKISDKQFDAFNKHFVAAGNIFENSGLSATDSFCDAPTISVSSRPCRFSFRPFSGHKVYEALSGIGAKKSTGADQLDPHLLLLAASVITDALTHIFNLTLVTGIIPTVRKTALVSPLHKYDPVDDLNNYRSLSLNCLVWLESERLVNSQLKMFFIYFLTF